MWFLAFMFQGRGNLAPSAPGWCITLHYIRPFHVPPWKLICGYTVPIAPPCINLEAYLLHYRLIGSMCDLHVTWILSKIDFALRFVHATTCCPTEGFPIWKLLAYHSQIIVVLAHFRTWVCAGTFYDPIKALGMLSVSRGLNLSLLLINPYQMNQAPAWKPSPCQRATVSCFNTVLTCRVTCPPAQPISAQYSTPCAPRQRDLLPW